MEADYATARGQFVRVATRFGADEPFAEATLVAAATNVTGQPFHVTDLARWSAHPDDPTTLTPRQLTVDAAADTLLLVCFISGGPGMYLATLSRSGTPPSDTGQATSCGSQGGDQTSYYWATLPAAAGSATATASAGGQGQITAEIFAIDTTA